MQTDYRSLAQQVFCTNVLRQLEVVAPDFSQNCVIARLEDLCKEDPQNRLANQFVKPQEPVVAYSSSPDVPISRRLGNKDFITSLVWDGYAVSISPRSIGRFSYVTDDILNEGPFDGLVVAEIPQGKSFSDARIIYSHRSELNGGPRVSDISHHLDK